MLLPRFSVPGNLREISEPALDAWSGVVSGIFTDVAAQNSRFYNPTVVETPADHRTHDVDWPALSGTLLMRRMSPEQIWKQADDSRDLQDEYCEWSVLNVDGKVKRVTFTSETPGYYEHLMDTDEETRQVLLDLYGRATGQVVSLDDLKDQHGMYKADNAFNNTTTGSIVHLAQDTNTLGAAVRLAGEATVLRHDAAGMPVESPQALVRCGGLGEATRHSDPRIASAVNNLVANGFDITLSDPPGLYLNALETTGMQTPDGTDAAAFWIVERGDAQHVVRARFEVPGEFGYSVGDITIGGRPIEFGAQLAARLHVRIEAVAKPSDVEAVREPCLS